MMSAIALLAAIITVEATPVAAVLRADQAGEAVRFGADLWLAIGGVFALSAIATLVPLRLGLRRLEKLEL